MTGITTTKEGRSAREEDSVHRHAEGTGPGGGGEVLCQAQAAGDQDEGAYRDIKLSRTEAKVAYILVTTQEKGGVVVLKGGGGSLGATCGPLIIDEVHLLADERGAVVESIVARLHRWIESSQRQVCLLLAWALCLLV